MLEATLVLARKHAVRNAISVSLLTLSLTGIAGAQVNNFAGNAQHTNVYNVPAVNINHIKWQATIDRNPSSFGHYGAPLVTAANTVIVPVKTETNGFEIQAFDASGTPKYTVSTDYTLPSYSWVPPYQPVMATVSGTTRLYYAGAGGTIFRLDNPDSGVAGVPTRYCFYTDIASYTLNASAYNSSIAINTPLVADSNGNVFFGFRVSGTAPAPLSSSQSGIARIDANGNGTYVLVGNAAADANITLTQNGSAPALSNDESTVYAYVRGASDAYSYLLGLDATSLATKYKVRLWDPRNNGNGARVIDQSTAGPMVAPDGDVYAPVFANPYNGSRGFLLHFTGDLSTQKTPGAFGWDFTPGLVPASMVPSYHGSSSYLLFCKYNNYNITDGDGVNRVALLDPNATQVDFHPTAPGLVVMREVMTVISPTPDAGGASYPDAVREWCINAASVNPPTHSILFNNEDGNLYRWDTASNVLSQVARLNEGVGQPYVPTVIGPDGTVYNLNGGYFFAMGGYDGGVSYTVTSSAPDMRKAVTGDSLTFTAKVNGGSGTPSGTFTFQDVTFDGTTQVTNTLASNVPVDSNGQASTTVSNLAAGGTIFGSHHIVAMYSGDAGHPAGQGEMLQKVHAFGTGTSVSTTSPSNFGDPVTITANVTSTGGSPTGYVTFLDGLTPIGQVYLNSGQAQFTVNNPSLGTHSFSAEYMSDTHFAFSSGSASHSVTAATSMTAGTSPNPSSYGSAVTLSASVSAVNSAAGTPTGTVTWKEGSTVLGSASVNGSGSASTTISTLGVGNHTITADFAGSNGWQNSSASAGTQSVTSATSTTLGSSANPSTYGASVTFTATVASSPAGAGTPTGSVVFTIDGVAGSPVALNGSGQATTSTSSLSLGSHTVSVAFTGTGGWQNSSSGSLSQAVQAGTTTALTSSVNSSSAGSSVTFAATVSSSVTGAGTPTGTVAFKDGATTLASVGVNGSGVATFSTSTLGVGAHTITAAFTGTGGWQNSSKSISQQVNDTTPPTVPQNVTAVSGPGKGQLTVSWSASTDGQSAVDHYEVWRGNKSTGPFSLAGTPTTTSYVDNPGKSQKRFYYVIAVDTYGNKSAKSVTVTASGLKVMALNLRLWF